MDSELVGMFIGGRKCSFKYLLQIRDAEQEEEQAYMDTHRGVLFSLSVVHCFLCCGSFEDISKLKWILRCLNWLLPRALGSSALSTGTGEVKQQLSKKLIGNSALDLSYS